ncbi:MAG TPA: NYN domain-containing protein, partial [Candidatus Paceibacterota bacterium]
VARGLHFTVSFKKLKDILRTYGRIIFADAFLSPATSNPQTITSLWNAGFQVIVCPMGSKDTDAVDSKLEWRARQYLRESTVAKVFVVSRDRDFSELVNFAADLGKQAVLFDIERHRGAIEGTEEEIVIELPQGKQVALFMRAVDYVGQGLSGLRPDDELRIKFLKDVIAAVSGKEEDNRRVGLRPPSFHVMHGSLIGVLGGQWRQSFTVMDFRNALTALVQQNAIVRRENHVTTFYELNREHPAVKAALLITK